MKLRFHGNSLRLRLNRQEVAELAGGRELEERIEFPGAAVLSYRLLARAAGSSEARLTGTTITVSIPSAAARTWKKSDDVGFYFRDGQLQVAIEKDLECSDAPPEERDPFAFPRPTAC